MLLADILIETYAMGSTLLRARKIEASGQETSASNTATVFLLDAMVRIEASARNLIGRCSDSANVQPHMKTVRELSA